MKIVFFMNFLLALAISVFLIFNSLKLRNREERQKVYFLFFIIGIIYFIFAVLSISWFVNLLEYNVSDFLFIQSIVVFFQTIFLFAIVYNFRRKRRIFYLLFLYLIAFSSLLIGANFSQFLLMTSFLLTIIIFLVLFSVPYFEKISFYGIIYSSVSLVLQLIILANENFSSWFGFISGILFFIFIFIFIKEMKVFPMHYFDKFDEEKKESYLINFLKYFIFIIILTNFIFIGTIGIHELGHFSVSKIAGCEYGKIVYEGGLPHTEILCGEEPWLFYIAILGGILTPLIVAILLFFGGGRFMKEVSFIVIGFDLIASYKDLMDLGCSESISLFSTIAGIFLIIISIAFLARSRVIENKFLHFG